MHRLYKTIQEEHDSPVDGKIKGSIPLWVAGSLYRNGPGMFEVGPDKYRHFFDGLAMFQRFHVADGKVTYQSRYFRSDTYKTNMAAQRIVINALGTVAIPDPCKTLFQRFMSRFTMGTDDNTLVNFFPLQDEIYAVSETQFIHRVDPETLDSLAKVDMSKYLAVNSSTAHPHVDDDGTVYNIAHSFKGRPKICVIKIPPKQDGNAEFPDCEIVATMPSPWKLNVSYVHSFALTENFFVCVEQPLFINLAKALVSKLSRNPIVEAIDWRPDIMARFRIISRQTGQEINPGVSFEADPFMVFHHVNGYEEEGHIIVDLVAHPSDAVLQDYAMMKNLTSEVPMPQEEPRVRRYVLPVHVSEKTSFGENLVSLVSSKATATRQKKNVIKLNFETIIEQGLELPRINYEKCNGKKYNYVYGIGLYTADDEPVTQTLIKADVQRKMCTEWKEEDCFPSEPVFVPHPQGSEEDDGVLLSAVNNTRYDEGNDAFLLVLDARTMKEVARASFDIPRFPRDIHGLFTRNSPTCGDKQRGGQ